MKRSGIRTERRLLFTREGSCVLGDSDHRPGDVVRTRGGRWETVEKVLPPLEKPGDSGWYQGSFLLGSNGEAGTAGP